MATATADFDRWIETPVTRTNMPQNMGQWRRLKGVNGDLGIKYANNNKKDILKKSTAKSLSRGNVPVTVANPQTSLWTVFTETVLYWRNSPYKLSKYNVLRIGNKNTVSYRAIKVTKGFFFRSCAHKIFDLCCCVLVSTR